MKKYVLFIIMVLLPLMASADAVEINGIYYNLVTKGKIAEVTSNPNNYSGIVVIPEKVEYEESEYSVTSIGSFAFLSCRSLTSITIPSTVTSIKAFGFYGCSGLTSITIPNSVKILEESAFSGCSNLTSITIPNSVTDIGEYAFEWCTGLTSITIPNSVTSIERGTFASCKGLTSISIPNSVTNIGIDAFYSCTGLTSITIPSSVTSIGIQAFIDCTGLNSVHITDLKSWCQISFNRYDSNPLYYAHHLYMNGVEIKDLVIPNNVTSIRDYAFNGCCDLTSVTIPNSVTNIGNYAFQNCSSLLSIELPNNVTSIGINTFENCKKLTTITIGNGIRSIGNHAFTSCIELTDVYCKAKEVPTIDSEVFKGSFINYATLHVPATSINAYSNAVGWEDFGSIVALTDGDSNPSGINIISNDETNGVHYYSIDGKQITKAQQGLNIIRMKDGTIRKVMMK